ncbi:MAG: outer membrane beta-barrel protein [Elusimicrobia bacterium]|nr:outer membrane beta-barrel protein [Elusimicrobiota bacterium]
MKRAVLLAALLLCGGRLAAQETASPRLPDLPGLEDLPEPTRYLAGYVTAGGGWAVPFGGHWGDKTSGFKPSQVFAVSASKRVDELLSYGLETSYAWNHVNRKMSSMKVKIFEIGPFVRVFFPEGETLYYGTLGAGVYQWSQPSFRSGGAAYSSDSGSSAGMSLGGGVSYPFWFGSRLGLDLRWHHIFNMKGSNFVLDTADNFNLLLTLHYGVWKDKKTAP